MPVGLLMCAHISDFEDRELLKIYILLPSSGEVTSKGADVVVHLCSRYICSQSWHVYWL